MNVSDPANKMVQTRVVTGHEHHLLDSVDTLIILKVFYYYYLFICLCYSDIHKQFSILTFFSIAIAFFK